VISEFLNALFKYKPENQYVLVWLLPSKLSAWFQDLTEAAAYIESVRDVASPKDPVDIYAGLGTSAKDWGSKARCPAANIAGIPGLWLDIDVAGPGHKKPNLVPTRAAAMELLLQGPQPTLIVNSGHGLHVYWLFKEFWVFETPSERQKAADLSARWSASWRERARYDGWDLDSVHDLSRVLRVPGTINYKDDPVPVEIVKP
jgi:hypothetical protein